MFLNSKNNSSRICIGFGLTFLFCFEVKAVYRDSCSCLVIHKGQQQVLDSSRGLRFFVWLGFLVLFWLVRLVFFFFFFSTLLPIMHTTKIVHLSSEHLCVYRGVPPPLLSLCRGLEHWRWLSWRLRTFLGLRPFISRTPPDLARAT